MASRSSKNNSFRRQNCNFKGASHFFVRFFAFFYVKLPKCYILSYVQTDATTSKIVGPTMLGLNVTLNIWQFSNTEQQLPQTRNNMQPLDATYNIQQCWGLLACLLGALWRK